MGLLDKARRVGEAIAPKKRGLLSRALSQIRSEEPADPAAVHTAAGNTGTAVTGGNPVQNQESEKYEAAARKKKAGDEKKTPGLLSRARSLRENDAAAPRPMGLLRRALGFRGSNAP